MHEIELFLGSEKVSGFVPAACPNASTIGANCNVSTTACITLEPCQNNGTCVDNDTIIHGYSCKCPMGFSGSGCQLDQRPCQPDTCLNDGLYFLACHV